MKCSKRTCPIQHDTISEDCNIEDCPYRTEDIEPQEVIKALCNYIADLVVQKLKTESDIEKRKPCTNYEDGCEEWAGCPCVHYKADGNDARYRKQEEK